MKNEFPQGCSGNAAHLHLRRCKLVMQATQLLAMFSSSSVRFLHTGHFCLCEALLQRLQLQLQISHSRSVVRRRRHRS